VLLISATMILYIKNMVCSRCKMVVKAALEKLGIMPLNIELGEVTIEKDLETSEKEQLELVLKELGFELIDDKKSRYIEKIKSLIIELIYEQNNDLKITLSDYLSQNVYHDYFYLSNLFSEIEGTTIEKYFIAQKIERVKELLAYKELSLGEIAFQLNYSSVAHLSNQFKKVTGLSPSHFKNIRLGGRKSLDEV
jgi:AraC-like DNA-binding protein